MGSITFEYPKYLFLSTQSAIGDAIRKADPKLLEDAIHHAEAESTSLEALEAVLHVLFHGTSSKHILYEPSEQIKNFRPTKENFQAVYYGELATSNALLDFDAMVDAIEYATSIEALSTAELLYSDFTDKFQYVLLKLKQIKRLFESNNSLLLGFLVGWIFGFPSTVVSTTRFVQARRNVNKAFLQLPGFLDFVRGKMDDVSTQGMDKAASLMKTHIRNFKAEEVQGDLFYHATGDRQALHAQVGKAEEAGDTNSNGKRMARSEKGRYAKRHSAAADSSLAVHDAPVMASGNSGRPESPILITSDRSSPVSDLSVEEEPPPSKNLDQLSDDTPRSPPDTAPINPPSKRVILKIKTTALSSFASAPQTTTNPTPEATNRTAKPSTMPRTKAQATVVPTRVSKRIAKGIKPPNRYK